MNFKWVLGIALTVTLLAGCGTPVEEQIATGFAASEKEFSNEAKEPNNKLDNIALFLPQGYELEKGDLENNYLIKNGNDLYVLFVNLLEDSSSKLSYDHLVSEQKDALIEVETFEEDGVFGYTAILENKEDEYELIAAIGGIKITTISAGKGLDEKLANMMTITKSVQFQ